MEWERLLREIGVRGDMSVRHVDGETHVKIAATYPHLRTGKPARYLITTEQQNLDRRGFPSRDLRDAIAFDSRKDRNRAIFCRDLRYDRTLAALSFHIDDSTRLPPHVTDLAVRLDEHRDHSRFAFVMLLDHLVEVLERDSHRPEAPREVSAAYGNNTERELRESVGFRNCASPAEFARSGTYMCWRRAPDRIVTRAARDRK